VLKFEEEQKEKPFTIQPNPSTGVFQINAPDGDISVFNHTGALVLRTKWDEESNEINISHLPAGLYSLLFQSGSRIEKRSILVVK
jgi:hypothetical protein